MTHLNDSCSPPHPTTANKRKTAVFSHLGTQLLYNDDDDDDDNENIIIINNDNNDDDDDNNE